MTASGQRRVIAIASDHAGFRLKQTLSDELRASGLAVLDLGTDSEQSVDYPIYARKVAEAVRSDEAALGVLICGTGIGMSITANRSPGIRAALCHNEQTARLARAHNDANVLVMGARIIDEDTARAILRTFLDTPFEGGRHQRRVALMA